MSLVAVCSGCQGALIEAEPADRPATLCKKRTKEKYMPLGIMTGASVPRSSPGLCNVMELQMGRAHEFHPLWGAVT